MNEQMPKTLPCQKCGVKPKQEIIGWSYRDSDDELFLVHKCKWEHIRFPLKGTFTSTRIEGQKLLVVKSWNELQVKGAQDVEGE